MIEAVFFDLDGTLFDDRQYVRGGLLNAADEFEAITGTDIGDELLRAYFDRGIRDTVFDTVLKEQGFSQEFVPKLVDAYHDNDAELVPFPGTIETLENLQNTYEMGVITGGTNGRDKLRRLGLMGYFDVIIVTADRDVSKRDPAPFKEALKALDVAADEAVFVGDRPGLDLDQPRRLGMYTVRVKTGQYRKMEGTNEGEHNVTLDTLTDLPTAITTISKTSDEVDRRHQPG